MKELSQEELESLFNELIGTESRDANGDIQFVDVDTEKTKTLIINLYETMTDRTLGRADPVRLFLETIAYIIVLLLMLINHTGKMNLLRYAVDDYLEELGYLVGTERLEATAALTTFAITLSEPRGEMIIIPQGARATAGDEVFFALTQNAVIPVGQTMVQVPGQCTQSGIIGNGYLAGEINQLVDPQPFVMSIVNITPTQGGSDEEADSHYSTRIHEAPERFSVAGPDGAYRFYAMSANPLIADAQPIMYPDPGDVTIYIILENGELPGEEVFNQVLAVVNDKTIRPLTDHVTVSAPTVVNYDIAGKYYIKNSDQSRATEIQAAVDKAVADFVLWEKSALGRDINPDELIERIKATGVKRVPLTKPTFQALTKDKIAIAQNITMAFGGFEDD